MPTYEYACRDCGARLEVVQAFADAPLTTCETCGGSLRKVFSAAGLIFKGSGWHIKDYRGGGATGTPGSSGASTSSGTADTSGAGGGSSGGSGDSGGGASSAPTPSSAPTGD